MFDMLQLGQRAGDADESAAVAPREFPLHLDGAERMRFRYALFLLNKVGSFCGRPRFARWVVLLLGGC